MTINEIKSKLGIDISIPCRKIENIVLKGLYVEKRFSELPDLKQTTAYDLIGKEINVKRSNIFNIFKNLEYYKTGEKTKLIHLAFTTGDKTYLAQYKAEIKKQQCSNYYMRTAEERKAKRILRQNKIKLQEVIPEKPYLNNLDVAEYLRKNKIKLSRFWDIHPRLYNKNLWDELRSYNPAMFDSYLKPL